MDESNNEPFLDWLIEIVVDIIVVWLIARSDRKKPGEEYNKEKGRFWIELIEGDANTKKREEEIRKGREERQRMLDIIDRYSDGE